MVGGNSLSAVVNPSSSKYEIKASPACVIWVAPRDLRPNLGEAFFMHIFKERLLVIEKQVIYYMNCSEKVILNHKNMIYIHIKHLELLL